MQWRNQSERATWSTDQQATESAKTERSWVGAGGRRSQKPAIDHFLIFIFEFVRFEAYDFRNIVITLYSVLCTSTILIFWCFDILLKYLFKLLSLTLTIITYGDNANLLLATC